MNPPQSSLVTPLGLEGVARVGGGRGCEGKVKWGWREGVGLEGVARVGGGKRAYN